MTLLPSESWNVFPVHGAAYKLAPNCYAPGCTRSAVHAHHLWRRSHGTNEAWVCLAYLDDKPIIGNLVGLCQECHADVTGEVGGHRAWIKFSDDHLRFEWFEKSDVAGRDWVYVAPLKFQPPGVAGAGHPSVEPSFPAPDGDAAAAENVLADTLEGHAVAIENVGLRILDEVGRVFDGPQIANVLREAAKLLRRRKPKAKKDDLPPGETRLKKTWTIKVPDDGEDGYAVLDSLLDAAAEKLGREEERSALVRYFTVVEALVFLLQHEVESE